VSADAILGREPQATVRRAARRVRTGPSVRDPSARG
jgi:hypothetical protein